MNFTFNTTQLILNNPTQIMECSTTLNDLNKSLNIKAIIVLTLMFLIFNIYLYYYENKKERTIKQTKFLNSLIIPYYIFYGFILAYLLFIL